MTTKQRFTYHAAYMALIELCEKHGRMVSAGEFAKHIGLSRNTAFNWLIDMLQEGAIEYQSEMRGRVPVARFGTWGYTFSGHKVGPEDVI